MRKPVLFVLLLAVAFSSRPASADPLRVTSGTVLLDIEGDIFTLNGDGFSLSTTEFLHYTTKQFPGRCDPSAGPFGFCPEAEGTPVDWSFHTTGGEQLLGTGNAQVGGVNATGVDFVGAMRVDVVPTPLSSGGTLDFDFVAPFSFMATIRGVQAGHELFAQEFTGSGLVRVNYEISSHPGVFAAADESITYEFAPTAATPEPGTLLLAVSGFAAAFVQRRRRSA